jgi:hypothetical protein
LKEPKAQVAAIGLAGENRVYMSTIEHSNSSASLTPDVNSGHETFFMQQPALHRIAAHRQPGIGNPGVLAVFGDCKIPRCIR